MSGTRYEETGNEDLTIHDDMIGHAVTQTVKDASEGDDEAARQILRDFVGAINQFNSRTWRGPVYWEFAQYLSSAFERILSGEDPGRALGVKKKSAGRRKGTGAIDQSELGAAYFLLIRKGYKSERAISTLSDHTGRDRRTIQRARKWAGDRLYNTKLYSESALRVLAGDLGTIIK
jgi:hypothetical protein